MPSAHAHSHGSRCAPLRAAKAPRLARGPSLWEHRLHVPWADVTHGANPLPRGPAAAPPTVHWSTACPPERGTPPPETTHSTARTARRAPAAAWRRCWYVFRRGVKQRMFSRGLSRSVHVTHTRKVTTPSLPLPPLNQHCITSVALNYYSLTCNAPQGASRLSHGLHGLPPDGRRATSQQGMSLHQHMFPHAPALLLRSIHSGRHFDA